jgi:urease accessory protein UreE
MGAPHRIVCVHALNGRPLFMRLDRDKFLLSKKPVVLIRDGERYEVREGREEIEEYIRDA